MKVLEYIWGIVSNEKTLGSQLTTSFKSNNSQDVPTRQAGCLLSLLLTTTAKSIQFEHLLFMLFI
jgi:hypothetical protein